MYGKEHIQVVVNTHYPKVYVDLMLFGKHGLHMDVEAAEIFMEELDRAIANARSIQSDRKPVNKG